MLKLLFLDIDGVLNSHRSVYATGGYPHGFSPNQMQMFDNIALGLIQRLCRIGNVKVVISSTWRIGRTKEELAKGLNLPVIGVTGQGHNGHRGKQIEEYLQGMQNVSHYAIVDDDSDMLDEQLPYFVKTPLENGLLFEHYEKLCRILRVKD